MQSQVGAFASIRTSFLELQHQKNLNMEEKHSDTLGSGPHSLPNRRMGRYTWAEGGTQTGIRGLAGLGLKQIASPVGGR